MPLGKRIKPEDNEKIELDNNLKYNSNQMIFKSIIPKYSFDDIILNKQTLDSLLDILAIYENHNLIFQDWGLSNTHKQQKKAGINLYGVSGTGKTMTAHAIAHKLNRRLMIVDYSQIESKFVGETSKNLVELFEVAKREGSILFFDEADALLSKRVYNMSNSTDVSVNQTRSVLLTVINDYDDLIIYATNFLTNYDQAFMRRILGHIRFDLPSRENRERLWILYIPNKMPTNVNVSELASKYDNLSGSDISNAVLLAALRASRENEQFVEHSFFVEAIEGILLGKADNGVSKAEQTIVSDKIVTEDYAKKAMAQNKNIGGLL